MNIGISGPLPAYKVDVAFMARKAEEHGQAPESARCQRFHDAGATRVTIRPPTASTDQETVEELEHIAETVIR